MGVLQNCVRYVELKENKRLGCLISLSMMSQKTGLAPLILLWPGICGHGGGEL
jgi:hypothetical protein